MKKLNMKDNNEKGFLFTFCGLDGCGKTTMIKMLEEKLKNKYNLFLTKQPTPSVRESAIFRNYMDSENHNEYDYRSLSLLAASDRVQHTNKVILSELQKGNIVISDRYFYSCLANLHARGYTKDKWIYEIAESIVKPDISFFFDVSVNKAVSRVRAREDERDRYIDMSLQRKLKKNYVDICKTNGGVLISTEKSIEESFADVMEAINKVLCPSQGEKENVIQVLKDISGKEHINETDSLQYELGLDSLSMVTLLIRIEEVFNIQLKESDMNPFVLTHVSSVIELVEKYLDIN